LYKQLSFIFEAYRDPEQKFGINQQARFWSDILLAIMNVMERKYFDTYSTGIGGQVSYC
jgi:hypothetical protein